MNNDYRNKTGDHFKGDGGIEDFQRFAGSVTCGNCHKDIYEKHVHSAHYLTSQPVAEKFIKGSFEPGKNKFAFDSNDVVVMEKRKDSFYQAEYYKGIEKTAERFDIVIGSGNKGQGYLYWRDNQLFQLPISYFTVANTWANSPGFLNAANFNRQIDARCLECHSTYFNTISYSLGGTEQYDRKEIIYGISCEKCHGPGLKHVEYQTANPKENMGKYIINPATFSRLQKLEMCALCHGGSLKKIKPSFSFMPGDSLYNFFTENKIPPKTADIDVHGKRKRQGGSIFATMYYLPQRCT
ncbi:MAG TPA: multiheme c-type cytochrome [Chitinophagaceae bacterium]|nr:multiheme c-type cytochrome [Chitinophagaceae bacterium]